MDVRIGGIANEEAMYDGTALRLVLKDFFYACPSHLTDRGFASPIVDEKAEAEKKKQEELAKEKAAVIKEYEEKKKKKGKEAKKKDDPVKTAEEEKDEKVSRYMALRFC